MGSEMCIRDRSSQFSTYLGDHRRFPALADRQDQEELRFLATRKSRGQRASDDTRSRQDRPRRTDNTNLSAPTQLATPRRPVQTLLAGKFPRDSPEHRGLTVSSPTGSSASLGALSQSMTMGTLSRSMTDVSACLLYTSPSPRDLSTSRMPSSA